MRKHGERLLDPAVVAKDGRDTHNFPDSLRMADGYLHRHASAHAVSDEIGPGNLEVIEESSDVVGQVLEREIARDVGSAPMTLHLDGDHLSGRRERGDHLRPVT